jgi:hypothetical protein
MAVNLSFCILWKFVTVTILLPFRDEEPPGCPKVAGIYFPGVIEMFSILQFANL